MVLTPTGERSKGIRRPAVRCRATSKRSRQPCRSYAVIGSDLCYMHGGAVGSGGDGGDGRPIEHGLYARFLPTNLREPYEYFKSDPNRLSTRSESAVGQAMLGAWLHKLEGLPLSAETIDVTLTWILRIGALKRDERKAESQDVRDGLILRGWGERVAAALQQILPKYLAPEQAATAAQEIGAAVAEISEVKPVVGI